MTQMHTAPPPAKAVRRCALPRCNTRLSDSNLGKYCRFHSADEIEAHEKTIAKEKPPPVDFPCVPCPSLSPKKLLSLVCAEWGVKISDVSVSLQGSHDNPVARAKRVFMCLAAVDKSMTNRAVSEVLGLKMTGSISTSIANAKKEIAEDPIVAEKVARIRSQYPKVPA